MEQLSIPQMKSDFEAPTKDRVIHFCYAILLTVAAYLFWSSVFRENALLLWITVSALFVLTFVVGMISGAKPNLLSVSMLICGVVFGAYGWINGLRFAPLYLYAHVLLLAYALLVLSLFRNHNRALHMGTFLLDTIKAVFVYPFISFIHYFLTLFRWNARSKRIGRNVLFVCIGIAAALILGLIAIVLLSYDPRFHELVKIDFNAEDIPEAILKIIISVPCAAVLFSAFRSSAEKKLPDFATQEKADRIGVSLKKIPAIVFAIPALTLLAIYGLFFFSQWDIYTGAFSGVLPAEYTAAEYARSGFFELCAVAAINAVVCFAFSVFSRGADRAAALCRKIVNTMFALATLILIATAFSKMFLYIRFYDLTVLRLFTSVVMLLLAIGFLLSIFAQWLRRVEVFPIMLVLTCALLLAVPFLNVRGRIARYNVDAYLQRAEQGVVENRIDCNYLLDDLGDAAIPEAVRLLESDKLNETDVQLVYTLLQSKHAHLQELASSRHTLASRRALNALNVLFGEPEQ